MRKRVIFLVVCCALSGCQNTEHEQSDKPKKQKPSDSVPEPSTKPDLRLLDINKLVEDIRWGTEPKFDGKHIVEPPQTGLRKPYYLKSDFSNLALNKPVSTNVEEAYIVHNDLSVITDGNIDCTTSFFKSGVNKNGANPYSQIDKPPFPYVGLLNGGVTPYVQIDLGKISTIYCIGLWHYYTKDRFVRVAFTDVVVQTADDKAFMKNVRTIYNNDHDNSIKLGSLIKRPTDRVFVTTKYGKLIPSHNDFNVNGWKGRYVRVYSDRCFYDHDLEARFVEIMVWGKACQPAGGPQVQNPDVQKQIVVYKLESIDGQWERVDIVEISKFKPPDKFYAMTVRNDHLSIERLLNISEKLKIGGLDVRCRYIKDRKALPGGLEEMKGNDALHSLRITCWDQSHLKQCASIPRLKVLDVIGRIDFFGSDSIGLGRLKSLERFRLSDAQNLTDKHLVELGDLKRLKYLDLRGCEGFTSKGISQLQRSLPECRIVYDEIWNR